MTFDYSKLRGKIVERYGTVKAFSGEMGFNPSWLIGILNSGKAFKTETAYKIANALGITDEIGDYFFTIAVLKTEHSA